MVLRTTRARIGHHVDRVGLHQAAGICIDFSLTRRIHHGIRHFVCAGRPGIDNFIVLLTARDQTVSILTLILSCQLTCLFHEDRLGSRDLHIVLTERNTRFTGLGKTEPHDLVTEDDRRFLTAQAINLIDQITDVLLGHQTIYKLRSDAFHARQDIRDFEAAWRCIDHRCVRITLGINALIASLDLGVQCHDFIVERMVQLIHSRDQQSLTWLTFFIEREIVKAKNDILRRNDNRLTIRGRQDVVRRHHQNARFELSFQRERHVHRHLVAVKVSVKGCADKRVQVDGFAFNQLWLKRLNTKTVKRRRAVEQNRVLADNLFKDIPDFRLFFFNQLLGSFNSASKTFCVKTGIDKRLEQLKRHLLRQTALMQFQIRANHDDRTTRIIDAFTKQVLAETPLLTFQHI